MSKTMVYKVVLGSGKTVLLREPKIKHQELAAQAAAPKAQDNQTLLALHMQKELLKIMVVQIDGTAMKPMMLEDLDAIFSVADYRQLLEVLKQLMEDGAEVGKSQVELVSFGET